MSLIGITGGVATGKSAVTALLRQKGAVTFSADEAARAVLAPDTPTLRQVAETFGNEFLLPDGRLDRARLGARIFSDPAARRALEALTHPPILALLHQQIAAAQEKDPAAIIAVEVPLLFEAGMEDWFDRIVVVAASEPTQIARLRARDGLSEEEARRRIATQRPLSEKIARADDVIWNEGTLADLAAPVEALWDRLRSSA